MPINKNYILKSIGDDYMLIPLVGDDLDFSKVYNLTETAAVIYKGLVDNKRIDEIVDIIMHEYDVSYIVAYKDTLDFIAELKKRGIYFE